MPSKRIIAPTLLLALFAALLIQLPLAIADRASVYDLYRTIADVRSILAEEYVEEPDEEAIPRAMISAMIQTLDDPYTQYVPPADTAAFNKSLHGTYAGIGAEVNISDGYLTIVTPMDDSPALAAGVMAGDIVLEIEGRSTYQLPLPECVELLTGEIGTEVNIRVRHLDGTEEDLAVMRDQIVARTVKGLRRIGEEWSYCVDAELGLSYVRVTQFNADTINELAAALAELQIGGLNGLILDLRDDPGGGLETAVAMADLFLDRGTILTVRPRTGEPAVFTASSNGTLPHFPMIVLVNGQSASASEIVAGALQENGRAKVLGTRSFGKGSVQEVRPLRYNGGTLKFTTAHYYLPSGRNINRMPDSETWGVDPDPGFVVPVTDEEYFQSFLARREYEIIRNGEITDAEPCVDADWIRQNMLDEQLASAVDALRARVRGEDWPVISDIDPGLVAFSQEYRRAAERRVRLIEELGRIDERIEELQSLASAAGRVPLLPPDADLIDGTLTVRDKHGNVIGTYHIEGGNLALALDTVALTPVEEEEAMSDER